jgi:hypothetical protein
MNNKNRIAKELYNALEDADCFENCPLKEVCDLVESESNNNNICRILESERN